MTDKIAEQPIPKQEEGDQPMTRSYTPSQIADGLLAGEFTRDSAFVPLAEVERLTRERDEARARVSKLWAVLEMVRDAVTCASTAAWEAAWAAARESTWTQSARVAREAAAARAGAAVDAQVAEFRRVCRELEAGRDPYPMEAKP